MTLKLLGKFKVLENIVHDYFDNLKKWFESGYLSLNAFFVRYPLIQVQK